MSKYVEGLVAVLIYVECMGTTYFNSKRWKYFGFPDASFGQHLVFRITDPYPINPPLAIFLAR